LKSGARISYTALVRTALSLALVAAGCASGSSDAVHDAPAGNGPDARVYLDGPIEPQRDALPPIDAPAVIDAAIDAPRLVDAAPSSDACVPQATQILLNPVFDLTPVGVDWMQTPISASYPLITTDSGYAPQSAPYLAWMGGLSGDDVGQASATDILYQDVTIPANTTQLVLTGYYTVGTSEDPNDFPYDTASVDLLRTDGTPIEAVLSLSNLTNTGAVWTAMAHTFTTNVSGQTVRLRLTSTNDITNATNFFFDTLALTATHCP
jgi:hypothetical protein